MRDFFGVAKHEGQGLYTQKAFSHPLPSFSSAIPLSATRLMKRKIEKRRGDQSAPFFVIS
jgi:hypothetical protein